jgi:hypothetical protein
VTWVVWRQYRAQGAIALLLLAAFAAVELTSGIRMASAWHALLRVCPVGQGDPSAGPACLGYVETGPVGNDLRVLSVMVPAVAGMLLGAPLVAHETETGTASFAWTQGITRSRWLLVKAGWLLLSAAVCAGVVAALVTFWSGPVNAMRGDQFGGSFFDTQGLVPVGYAVFATALGIAAGALLRRTLPAIAVTLGVFIGFRVVFDTWARQHLMPAVTHLGSLTAPWSPPGIAWILGSDIVDTSGRVFNGTFFDNGYTITDACGRVAASGGPQAGLSCMQAAGYRMSLTYQPAWRYWPFQGIETGIYLLLAAALVALAWAVVRRRDA